MEIVRDSLIENPHIQYISSKAVGKTNDRPLDVVSECIDNTKQVASMVMPPD